jgi:hypothetical protein
VYKLQEASDTVIDDSSSELIVLHSSKEDFAGQASVGIVSRPSSHLGSVTGAQLFRENEIATSDLELEDQMQDCSVGSAPTTVLKIKELPALEKWRHFRIPESTHELRAFLEYMHPGIDRRAAATAILTVLVDWKNHAIVSGRDWSDFVDMTECDNETLDVLDDEPILVMLTFQASMDMSTCTLAREVTCISCSSEAASQLGLLAERMDILSSLSSWRAQSSGCLVQAVHQLQSLPAQQLLGAVTAKHLFCFIGEGRSNFRWCIVGDDSESRYVPLWSMLSSLDAGWIIHSIALPSDHGVAMPDWPGMADTEQLRNVSGILVDSTASSSSVENKIDWNCLLFDERGHRMSIERRHTVRGIVIVFANNTLSIETERIFRGAFPQAQLEQAHWHLLSMATRAMDVDMNETTT